MVVSFSLSPIVTQYDENFYRVFKFNDQNFLITTDHGRWVLLDAEEYRLLRTHNVFRDPHLFTKLRNNGIIITEDNFDEVVENYRTRFHFLFKGPTLHIVIPTFRCNFDCVYCHSVARPMSAKGFDMDEETAKNVVDFIFTSPSDNILIEFQGGDPLARFDIVKFIVDYASEKAKEKNKKVTFSLVTNLTMMDEEKMDFFKSRKIIGLATSLDGPKELHNKNRRYALTGAGTYDDVVYWIKRIKTEWKYDVNLNALTTITRFSLPYWKEIPQTLKDLGFNMVWFRFLNNLGFAKSNWKRIGYTAEEFLAFYRKGLDYVLGLNSGKKTFIECFATIIAKKILILPDPMFVDLQAPCGAGGVGQLLYDHKGDIYTCDEAKVLGETFKLGNVRNTTLQDVLSNPITIAMMNVSSKLPLICDWCPWSPYCGICPVHLYLTQGSIVPKLAGEFRCRIFGEIIKMIFEKILFNPKERKIIFKWAGTILL